MVVTIIFMPFGLSGALRRYAYRWFGLGAEPVILARWDIETTIARRTPNAKAGGPTIPLRLLLRANQVIESPPPGWLNCCARSVPNSGSRQLILDYFGSRSPTEPAFCSKTFRALPRVMFEI